MSEFFTMFSELHVFIQWCSLWLLWGVIGIIKWPFRIVNRIIRHANIRASGWPPLHLGADGDKIEKNESEGES